MENASKALIIAGAILISIVLVSVGVIVVNTLNADEYASQISQQEVDTINSRFVSSAGLNRQGSIAISTVSSVITNNSGYEVKDPRRIEVTITEASGNTADKETDPNKLSKARNQINRSSRYDIEISYDDKTGLVNLITITNTNTNTKK